MTPKASIKANKIDKLVVRGRTSGSKHISKQTKWSSSRTSWGFYELGREASRCVWPACTAGHSIAARAIASRRAAAAPLPSCSGQPWLRGSGAAAPTPWAARVHYGMSSGASMLVTCAKGWRRKTRPDAFAARRCASLSGAAGRGAPHVAASFRWSY